ncbi:MAG TPA: hypothetical protein VF767_01200 [Bryobacteraceae bacterium]
MAAPITLAPQFARGRLVATHVTGREKQSFSVYSTDGRLVKRIHVEIPGAGRTIQSAVLPVKDGYVALAIAVRGSERDSVLCFLDRDGRLLKTAETRPFSPELITVAADGCIWGFGSTNHADVPTSDVPVLYRFSPSGEALNKLLPRNLFGDFPPFAAGPDDTGMPALISAGNRVVLYAPQTRSLYEIGLDGQVLGSYVVRIPDNLHPLRLAVTEDGAIYARLVGGPARGIYELDRANSSWAAAPSDAMAAFASAALLGSDGDDLVLSIGRVNSGAEVIRVRLARRFATAP